MTHVISNQNKRLIRLEKFAEVNLSSASCCVCVHVWVCRFTIFQLSEAVRQRFDVLYGNLVNQQRSKAAERWKKICVFSLWDQ